MPSARRASPARRDHERLLGATLALVVLGAIWVYSASSSEQILQGGGDGTGFLVRYVGFGLVGFVALAVAARHGVALLRRITLPLLAISIVLCLAVLVPGLGREVNGATRWLGTSSFSFQPSELAKFALVAYLAMTLADRRRPMRTLADVAPSLLVIGLFVAIVGMLQRDLGTALVLAGASLVVLLVAGMPFRLLAPLGALALVGGIFLILLEPYRMARIATFLQPWNDAAGTGYQATQGQLALGSGGLLGQGLGQSVQKAEWLPEAHTDFILAIVGEELGAFGVGTLLLLYAIVAYSGLRIADGARTLHEKLVAVGITGVVITQAILNVWVVLGLFPLTGVPLPFISYGSTNLVVLLVGVGLLLDIARRAPHLAAVPDPAGSPDGGPGGRQRDGRERDLREARRRARTAARRGAPSTGRAPAGRPTPATARASRSAGGDVRDRGRRDGGARRAGAGGGRRAAG